ncbi:MAG: SDR family oxidoreductase [Bacillota bacterium]|nr:SDR family oxidoreductase [Bacillota bacterium]
MLQNKTAVITGATSGIGAAYASKFAQQGYDLIITGRRKEKIEATATQIRQKYNVNVDVILTELSETEEIKNLTDFMKEKEIGVLVNNAGFGANSLYQTSDLTIMEQLAKVNVIAPMELIHAVLPGMVVRGKGTIINISSESVYMIIPKNAVYTAAKSFLKSFTEGLHLDLMGTGVKVMAVCPGLTHTDFHEKMGMEKSRQINKGQIKWMSPEEVVDISLRDMKKGKVVCIPGNHTKMLTHLLNMMPRRIYYKFMYNFSCKNFGKKNKTE